jgi:hypothetical protein
MCGWLFGSVCISFHFFCLFDISTVVSQGDAELVYSRYKPSSIRQFGCIGEGLFPVIECTGFSHIVKRQVDLLQVFGGCMGVDFCGFAAAVCQPFLNVG